jgi:hypothetical protein
MAIDASVSFADQVSQWVLKTQKRQDAVLRESVQRLKDEMQKVGPSVANPAGGEGGNMPVDTGFLRASIQASFDGPIPMRAGAFADKSKTYAYDPAPLVALIAKMKVGQTIWLTYGAAYARAVEYGARGHPGYAFVRKAAQKWPQIVEQVSKEAQQRSEAGARS